MTRSVPRAVLGQKTKTRGTGPPGGRAAHGSPFQEAPLAPRTQSPDSDPMNAPDLFRPDLGPFPYEDGWGWLYRACVFEMLHLPFFLTLVALAVARGAEGRWDLALENTVVNAVVNLYPMMHHRRTRGRIARLLSRRAGDP